MTKRGGELKSFHKKKTTKNENKKKSIKKKNLKFHFKIN